MTIKAVYQKISKGSWHKLIASLFIIATSVYDILEDLSKIRKEHGVLLIGVLMMVKSIGEIIEKAKKNLEQINEAEKPPA